MPPFRRLAIYAAPPAGPLADAAAAWLGWNPETGRMVAPPDLPALPRPLDEITARPRRYGFHATLKPPFRLSPDSSLSALDAQTRDLAARLAPVTLAGLSLTRMGGFLALTPEGDTGAIDHLAGEVVRALDSHRAPPTPEEIARHGASVRTQEQAENLARWGYPRVMGAFRFHFTLTGRLARAEVQAVSDALGAHLLGHVPRPFPVAALGLFGEDDAGRFHLVSRHPLLGQGTG